MIYLIKKVKLNNGPGGGEPSKLNNGRGEGEPPRSTHTMEVIVIRWPQYLDPGTFCSQGGVHVDIIAMAYVKRFQVGAVIQDS